MKKFVLLSCFISTCTLAESVKVLEVQIPEASQSDKATKTFRIDETTGEGSIDVKIEHLEWETTQDLSPVSCYPTSCVPNHGIDIHPVYKTIFTERVQVEGLMVHGDRFIYSGKSGDVNCGKLKQSRVFKTPTIHLNGKCKISSKLDRKGNLSVNLNTK